MVVLSFEKVKVEEGKKDRFYNVMSPLIIVNIIYCYSSITSPRYQNHAPISKKHNDIHALDPDGTAFVTTFGPTTSKLVPKKSALQDLRNQTDLENAVFMSERQRLDGYFTLIFSIRAPVFPGYNGSEVRSRCSSDKAEFLKNIFSRNLFFLSSNGGSK